MATLLIIGGGLVTAGGIGASLFGFGTAGIAAGSAAAAVQAGIGNVAAGSIFATLTSWGMTGVYTTAAGGGAVSTALGVIASFF